MSKEDEEELNVVSSKLKILEPLLEELERRKVMLECLCDSRIISRRRRGGRTWKETFNHFIEHCYSSNLLSFAVISNQETSKL